MNVVHRDLSSLAGHMAAAAPSPKVRSMLTEMSDRYEREPDREASPQELYKQALRMTEFGQDGGEKIKLGRAAMQWMSLRSACQVAGSFCVQAATAVQNYDCELSIYRAALKQPEAMEGNNVARLGLEMMAVCDRFPIDQAKIGELACRTLSDRPEAGEALKQVSLNRTHNADGRLYKEVLTRLADTSPAPGDAAPVVQAPPTLVQRLDRVTGVQKSYDTMLELLKEVDAPAAKIGLQMLEKSNDYRVCLLAGRTILEDQDAGQRDTLATMKRVVDTLMVYPHSPIDKGEVAAIALGAFKGKLEHEPIASVAFAAASQTSTFLAQLAVCKVGLEALSENPRPGPGVLGERVLEAALTINPKSASRAGQAALKAVCALYDTPEMKALVERLDARLDESSDYKDDLPIIRETLAQVTELPAPAQGSLLAMARASAGLGDSGAIGEQNGSLVVGGVRVKMKKREWEGADQPKN